MAALSPTQSPSPQPRNLGLAGITVEAPADWLEELFSLHGIGTGPAEAYLSTSPFYTGKHWPLPKNAARPRGDPTLPRDDDIDAQIQHRFMDIFNDVIGHFTTGFNRKVLATQPTDDETDDIHYNYAWEEDSEEPPHYSTRPDLVLLGDDRVIFPRSVDSYTKSMSVDFGERRELYRGSVVVGKVQRYRRENELDRMLEKVDACARQCFLHQPGRRFVYVFALLKRQDFQLFLFDRSGIVRSSTINIHKKAVTFVRAIQMLTGTVQDLSLLGFDRAVYWERGSQFITVGVRGNGSQVKDARYKVDHVIAQNPSAAGRGTVCWGVKKVGEGVMRVLKDAWLDDKERPQDTYIALAQRKGIEGVPKLLSTDVLAPERMEPRSISRTRLSQGITTPMEPDRVFTRSLFEYAGESLEQCAPGPRMLQALRSAISTHLSLVEAGILHRDICPSNILLGKDDGGPRGILIDFKSAIACVDGAVPTQQDSLVGSLHFQSVNRLGKSEYHDGMNPEPHNFTDDLEAFFWVYVCIVLHGGPPGNRDPSAGRSGFIARWMEADEETQEEMYKIKKLYLTRGTYRGKSAKFPDPFSHPAYNRLFRGLRKLFIQCLNAREDRVDVFRNMDGIYGEVLSLFDAAIEEVAEPRHRVQPDRPGKRPREEDKPINEGKIKRPKSAPRQPKRAKAPSPKAEETVAGTRRSSRLLALRQKAALAVAATAPAAPRPGGKRAPRPKRAV